VSTCANGHRFAWIERPDACPQCGDAGLTDDPDVLDTWFSSALWPFAIFGWPDDTADLRRFYPTDVLVTAREIIFLWVARMVMTGLRFAGAIPFSDVIINSTILALDGSRMSKSKGNVVDPLDMIERYGADAVRAWAGAVGTSGQDMRFDENRIASYRLFANKLWNATRLLVTRLGDGERIAAVAEVEPETLLAEDRWILARVAATVEAADAGIAGYRFHEVMERLYDVTWHGFCDWYVEMVKGRLGDEADPASRAAAAWTAVSVLDTLLRLLHPLMPFVTEELWAETAPQGGRATMLIVSPWPEFPEEYDDGVARYQIGWVVTTIEAGRSVRSDLGVPASARSALMIDAASDEQREAFQAHSAAIRQMLRVGEVDFGSEPGSGWAPFIGQVQCWLKLGELIDFEAQLARIAKELAVQAGEVERAQRKLDNPRFTLKAPPEVVKEAEDRRDEALGAQ
ncbi:MAG: class I tRNA ligase family protein, partial [Candidatus Dormibacteria bacterium]